MCVLSFYLNLCVYFSQEDDSASVISAAACIFCAKRRENHSAARVTEDASGCDGAVNLGVLARRRVNALAAVGLLVSRRGLPLGSIFSQPTTWETKMCFFALIRFALCFCWVSGGLDAPNSPTLSYRGSSAHTGRERNTIRVYRPRSRLTNARAAHRHWHKAVRMVLCNTIGYWLSAQMCELLSSKMTRLDPLSNLYLHSTRRINESTYLKKDAKINISVCVWTQSPFKEVGDWIF